MTGEPGTSATGPLAGVTVLELGGIGPLPLLAMLFADLGARIIRVDPAGPVVRHHRPPPLDLPRPRVGDDRPPPDRGAGARAAARRTRRHPGGGVPARGRRTPRRGTRRLPRPQPAPGLRPDDRLGPGRSAVGPGRPRHQLHRPHRRAGSDGPARRAAAGAAQPGRRLRRRGDDAGDGRARRAARARAERAGAGRRGGDVRRHARAHGALLRDARRRPLGRRTRREPTSRVRAVLPVLRDERRPVHGGRRGRGQVLRRAPRRARVRSCDGRDPARPRAVARAHARVRGCVPFAHACRVGSRVRDRATRASRRCSA